jgi:hypothetical protein
MVSTSRFVEDVGGDVARTGETGTATAVGSSGTTVVDALVSTPTVAETCGVSDLTGISDEVVPATLGDVVAQSTGVAGGGGGGDSGLSAGAAIHSGWAVEFLRDTPVVCCANVFTPPLETATADVMLRSADIRVWVGVI